jgi:hypothetical protein
VTTSLGVGAGFTGLAGEVGVETSTAGKTSSIVTGLTGGVVSSTTFAVTSGVTSFSEKMVSSLTGRAGVIGTTNSTSGVFTISTKITSWEEMGRALSTGGVTGTFQAVAVEFFA